MTYQSNAVAQTAPQTNDQPAVINGVDVTVVTEVIEAIEVDKTLAQAQFRAKNRWVDGGLNRTHIKGFYAGGQEDDTRTESFTLNNDEPMIIAGGDTTPNPVEYVLHALAGCLTTTMVYHAAVQGIAIEAIESQLEGDIDLRGLFGLSDTVRKGYQDVRVTMRVKSDADAGHLKELAMFSPVYDMVSGSVPVTLTVEKM